MRQIKIVDLRIFAYHGVYAQEKADGQEFLVSAELDLTGEFSSADDSLEGTVDYAEICRDINGFMTENTFNLIETAADWLALLLLKRYNTLHAARIEVKKPFAPIGLPLSFVSAVCCRSRHTAFIGLGSNMGERARHIETALLAIEARGTCRILKKSDCLVTAPYGKTDQPDFLNACAKISTVLEPLELLRFLQEIEDGSGRVRTEKWGPRTLDLDILFYDDLVLSEPWLTVPHYDLHNRLFILDALCTLEPWRVHPVFGLSLCALAEKQRQIENAEHERRRAEESNSGGSGNR